MPPEDTRLENPFEAKLYLPGALGSPDLTETRRRPVCVGISKARVVEDIERLGTKLHVHSIARQS